MWRPGTSDGRLTRLNYIPIRTHVINKLRYPRLPCGVCVPPFLPFFRSGLICVLLTQKPGSESNTWETSDISVCLPLSQCHTAFLSFFLALIVEGLCTPTEDAFRRGMYVRGP